MSAGDGGRIRKENNVNRVGCNTCAHFYITWNKRYPYGCSVMRFMSSKLPSQDVLEVEGRDCLSFQHKNLEITGDEDARKNQNGNRQVNVIV